MIAEAMAHGKPVVGTRVGAIPELISDNLTGHLVDRGNTKAMSETVLDLLNDQNKRSRMVRLRAKWLRKGSTCETTSRKSWRSMELPDPQVQGSLKVKIKPSQTLLLVIFERQLSRL
jgi:glycosyltransferase involved in cell wall biosynthesis